MVFNLQTFNGLPKWQENKELPRRHLGTGQKPDSRLNSYCYTTSPNGYSCVYICENKMIKWISGKNE